MKNKLLLLIIATLTLAGCRSTNIVTMSVTEPAPVNLPSTIKTVGVINRTLPAEGNQHIDKADKILSLEGVNLDKESAAKSISGLTTELQKNSRFTEVKFLESVNLKTAGLGVFPASLSWEVVEKVCKENKVDALFALELLDTDAKVNYAAVPVTLKGPLGVEIPAIEHVATVNTVIKIGWRIYDPAGKNIIDEFSTSAMVTSTGRGINPAVAAEAVIGRKEAVLERSNGLGQSYALSLLPYKTRVARDYYVRGTDNFKIAKRKARTGNWDQAAELWQKETNNPKNKVAGRATYNMAIISEINGDLDLAIQWAQKAYENYNNKLALRYANILKYRKQQNNQLKRQEEQQQ